MNNTLFYYMRQGMGANVVIPTKTMLEQYTKLHFLTEESLLEISEYPDPTLEEHKVLYTDLITKMYQASRKSRKYSDPLVFLEFLKEWWTVHINQKDHEYIRHLRRHLNRRRKLPLEKAGRR